MLALTASPTTCTLSVEPEKLRLLGGTSRARQAVSNYAPVRGPHAHVQGASLKACGGRPSTVFSAPDACVRLKNARASAIALLGALAMCEPRTDKLDQINQLLFDLDLHLGDISGAIDVLRLISEGGGKEHNPYAYIAGQMTEHQRRCQDLLDAAFSMSARSREVA